MRAIFNMTMSPYLMEILNNYFEGRKVIYLMDAGQKECIVMAGILAKGLCILTTTMEHYVRWSTATAIAKWDYNFGHFR